MKEINLKQHVKPIFTIFLATISINIYLQLDNFLIGSISGDKYVGFYAMSNKLIRYAIAFITIIGAVMLPRLSLLFVNDKEQYHRYLRKSLNLMMILAIPCTVYFFVFSKNIISFMGGEEFVPSILTMQILSPLCVIVSLAYFFGFLILYPQGLEKIYTRATIFSAIFSVLVNFYAVKYFQQNGAATIAVLAELFAVIFMFTSLRKLKILDKMFDANLLKILGVNIILFVMLFTLLLMNNGYLEFINFLICTVVFLVGYALLLFLFKEENILDVFNLITQKK
ncbi:colanic acid exporter [compost metagenome]